MRFRAHLDAYTSVLAIILLAAGLALMLSVANSIH